MDSGIDINIILTGVIIAILGGAFKYGRAWILTKIASSKNALFVQYMNTLADVVFDVVSAAMQTTVNDYKASGGKLDETFAATVKRNAIAAVKRQLAGNICAYLEKATGHPIEEIIGTQVEKSVVAYKIAVNSSGTRGG
jgi:hypothetical protein